jgi:SAM-dependent methyltransferase
VKRRLEFELWYLLGRAPWDSGISPPELLAFLQRHPPGRAIDLGCGTGTNAIRMAQHGWRVTGIDASAVAVARARRKAKRAGVELRLRRGDVTRMDLDGPFDLALDLGCFHALPPSRWPEYVRRLAAALRPGGTLLLYIFLGDWVPEAELRAMLSPALDPVQVVYGSDVVRGRPSAWFTLQRREA